MNFLFNKLFCNVSFFSIVRFLSDGTRSMVRLFERWEDLNVEKICVVIAELYGENCLSTLGGVETIRQNVQKAWEILYTLLGNKV